MNPRQEFDQRRFAGSVLPAKRVDLTRPQIEIHVAQSNNAGKFFNEPACFKKRCSHVMYFSTLPDRRHTPNETVGQKRTRTYFAKFFHLFQMLLMPFLFASKYTSSLHP